MLRWSTPAAILAAAESEDDAAAAENSTSDPAVEAVEVLLPVLPVLPWLFSDSNVTFPIGLEGNPMTDCWRVCREETL